MGKASAPRGGTVRRGHALVSDTAGGRQELVRRRQVAFGHVCEGTQPGFGEILSSVSVYGPKPGDETFTSR